MKTLTIFAVAAIGAGILSAQEGKPTGVFYTQEAPRLTTTVEPECSQQAMQAGISDVVTLRVQIDDQGEPVGLEVVESPGYGLGPKALEAVSQWRWRVAPEQFQGKERRVEAGVQMSFQCRPVPWKPAAK